MTDTIDKPLKILFDISIFSAGIEHNSSRSGIFFTGYNIFNTMLEREDVELHVYSKIEYIVSANTFLNNMPEYKLKKVNFYSGYHKGLEAGKALLKDDFTKKINSTQNLVLKLLYRLRRKINYIKVYSIQFLNKVDVSEYCCYFSPVYDAPAFICNNKKLKRLTLLYDTIPIKFPEFYPDMKSDFWFKRLLKQINKNDYYIAISECTKKDFLEIADIDPAKIYTTYLAPSSNIIHCEDTAEVTRVRCKYKIPNDVRYILSICSLEPRKNIIFAIEAFLNYIHNNNVNDCVYVLGGGHWDSFMPLLEKKLNSLNRYKDKIIIAGYIPDEDMGALYSGAEMFIYPSLYEGFGIPIIEAMKCGVPVIASNVSSIPEITGDGALLIDPNDLKALEYNISKLYENRVLREFLRNKGFEQSSNFTWTNTVNEIIMIINELTTK